MDIKGILIAYKHFYSNLIIIFVDNVILKIYTFPSIFRAVNFYLFNLEIIFLTIYVVLILLMFVLKFYSLMGLITSYK